MDISLGQRRALEPVDSNSRNPPSKHEASKPTASPDSPKKTDCSIIKRRFDLGEAVDQRLECLLDQPAKRQRVSASEDAQRITIEKQSARADPCDDDYKIGNGDGDDNEDHINSHDLYAEHQGSEPSDGESSMFDISVIDTSQATTITEPDAEVVVHGPPASPRRQPSMSREEARQKAEKLRLRLGLASYKVRTGQMDVPLDQLKVKPLMNVSRPKSLARSSSLLPRREEVEDNDEERQWRPMTATRKELGAVSTYYREGNSDQARSPSTRALLLELQPPNPT